MHPFAFLLAAAYVHATPIIGIQSDLQAPLEDPTVQPHTSGRQLHGRFLHITDLHPDSFYKFHSSTEEEDACHRGKGTSGVYGAETTDCDTPYALVNATFKWIQENIKDNIDFVVWTGDSARHDSDEEIPRTQDEVLSTNRWVASKFLEVFGKNGDPTKPLTIPIVSTFGNNDILPHNILLSGPNKWLKAYTDIWGRFIPEEQRHGFERGGWYYVEVIPNKLAVFSLNTLYFFSHNAAVDGCALRSEPGYEHLEWLRIQLQFMRRRGMKAILTGHVPPARTGSKQLWDETCWQKYTLWLRQYRDVVVGGLYGHMNIDHFMLQDTKEVNLLAIEGTPAANHIARAKMDEELTIESANDYLEELRENWSDLPNPPAATEEVEDSKKKGKKTKKEKNLKKIGGPWGERFHVTHVGPSVVPNFMPTLRVIEYNISGLQETPVWAQGSTESQDDSMDWLEEANLRSDGYADGNELGEHFEDDDVSVGEKKKRKKKKKKKHQKPKNPDLIVPDPPTKGSPPGPAYSPQTLTLLGYTQYFANLTHINNDFVRSEDEDVDIDKWHEGTHHGKHPKDKAPKPKPFQYQVEYDTFTDPIYKLTDLTVRSYIKLAHRIGQYEPEKTDQIEESLREIEDGEDEVYAEGKKHRKKKHHKQHEKNKVWLRFIQRAFVGTLNDEDLKSFEQDESPELLADEWRGEL
ncbi:Endopolyphosphatase [Hyphodiscus hymeniophilus]|uniref:Endopolyphosphatase n=1 Tax=Hyphodiscus hymeniophilus TaxID=353542 RepID=A0A9P6VKK9_9HELO|nr:Endopolyphosphatase [Hyphodiscus hymeniophilus]